MAAMDPVTIAQTGVDPITGSPLSKEVRKALFKRVITPSTVFGRGGSLVKSTTDSSSLVVAQTQQITNLQDQLSVLRVEVSVLNAGLSNIGNIIQQDSALEQQRLSSEQEDERKNLEQQVRLGKENQLEQRIQSALAKPIVALQNKVSNIFSNIFGALSTLFAGWLTDQGIEAIKALESGNRKKLEEIKDTVLKNILYAIGGIAAVKVGFGLITRSIIGLASRIGGIALKLALAPFRLAGSQLAKIPGIGKMFGGGKKPPTTPKVTTSGGNWMSRIGNFFRGAGSATKGATSTAARTAGRGIMGALPIVGTGLDIWGATAELGKGNITGAALYGAGAITSLIPGLQPLSGALSVAAFGQSLTYKPQLQSGVTPQTPVFQDQTKETESAPKVAPQTSTLQLQESQTEPITTFTTEPQTSMIRKQQEDKESSKLSATTSAIMSERMGNLSFPFQKENVFEFQADVGNNLKNVNMDVSNSYSIPSLVSVEQIQNIPKEMVNIGTLSEPEPNVIIMPSNSRKRQQSMLSNSEIPNIPMVNSANPNNFYVLYSQLNYNVVI